MKKHVALQRRISHLEAEAATRQRNAETWEDRGDFDDWVERVAGGGQILLDLGVPLSQALGYREVLHPLEAAGLDALDTPLSEDSIDVLIPPPDSSMSWERRIITGAIRLLLTRGVQPSRLFSS